MTQIAKNLHNILQKIEKSAQKAQLSNHRTLLVAVSKTQPAEAIEDALLAGQRLFGENRVAEAQSKFIDLKKRFSDIELHLIGPLQTNKVAAAVALFDVIQTVDRPKLAEALAKEIKKQGRTPRLFIEVNTGLEPQKAGVDPETTGDFLAYCEGTLGLKISGLMCIPPADQDPTPHFALLKKLAESLNLPFISMGMSADFEKAVELGATHVRVGTAIFGERRQ